MHPEQIEKRQNEEKELAELKISQENVLLEIKKIVIEERQLAEKILKREDARKILDEVKNIRHDL